MSAALFRFENSETDDDGDLQTVKGMGYAGEELSGVHRVMPFGISSHAPAGSHAIGIAGRGERSLVAALGLEHPDYRPKKQSAGNTTIYDQSGNASRYLGKDGVWHDAGDRPQKVTGKTVVVEATEKVTVKVGDMVVVVTKNRIDLGADPAPNAVVTTAGPSTKVFAVI